MKQEILDIRSACEEVLASFIEKTHDWRYVRSKKSFVRDISKNAFVDIFTGMSSKVDFVTFQFSLHIGHTLIGKADRLRKGNNWAIVRVPERWLDKNLNWGSCTVFNHDDPLMKEFDQLREQGKKNYVRLEELPDWLSSVFFLAEVEIKKNFDTSSEEALIKSIVGKPIGTFRPNDVLLIQLLLGNSVYYDQLIEFYSQDIELVRSMTMEPFNQHAAAELMMRYRQGDLPKFEFS